MGFIADLGTMLPIVSPISIVSLIMSPESPNATEFPKFLD